MSHRIGSLSEYSTAPDITYTDLKIEKIELSKKALLKLWFRGKKCERGIHRFEVTYHEGSSVAWETYSPICTRCKQIFRTRTDIMSIANRGGLTTDEWNKIRQNDAMKSSGWFLFGEEEE